MAQTPNYEWDLPTPGGSAGVWGNVLNAAIFDIDATLDALESSINNNLVALDAAKLSRSGGLMTGPTRHSLVELGSVSGSTTINLAQGNVFRCTISGSNSASFTFSNPPSNDEPTFVAIEIQAGSSASASWPAVIWNGGSAPNLASGVNVIVLMIRGSNRRGVHAVRPS